MLLSAVIKIAPYWRAEDNLLRYNLRGAYSLLQRKTSSNNVHKSRVCKVSIHESWFYGVFFRTVPECIGTAGSLRGGLNLSASLPFLNREG